MSNLRIVYDNAADRATLSASSTAGSLGVSNLLTETKGEVWRGTSTSETITMQWSDSEFIGVVALPFCNLSSTATMRVRGYTEVADSVPAIDTGAVLACPYAPLGLWAWGTQPLGVNSYSYGGGTYGVVWFDITPVKKLVIDIVDVDNESGYIEAARAITGVYWTPENNVENGAVQITLQDSSKHERTDAGDLRTDRGTISKSISFDLRCMPPTDRSALWNIVRGGGMARPLFFSLTPESDDASEEQMCQLYCKLSKQASITFQYLNSYGTQLELEEV